MCIIFYTLGNTKMLLYSFLNVSYIKLQCPHSTKTWFQFSTHWTSSPSPIPSQVMQRSWAVYSDQKIQEIPLRLEITSSHQGFSSVQFSRSVVLTLWDPMNCSTPGLLVHHQLPESTQTHVHQVGDAIQPSHPVVPFSSCLQSFPASGSFQMSQLFSWGGQRIGVSASASVLPMNTQDWSPSGWTGWISLQSKGLSRIFSNTTVQKHQFFSAQLSSQSNSHIHTWLLEKP